MGKTTEQLSEILQTPKSGLVQKVKNLISLLNVPPFNVNITYVNGKLYVNNNLALFNLDEGQKLELLKNILTDALNSVNDKIQHQTPPDENLSQNNAELTHCVGCDVCNNNDCGNDCDDDCTFVDGVL